MKSFKPLLVAIALVANVACDTDHSPHPPVGPIVPNTAAPIRAPEETAPASAPATSPQSGPTTGPQSGSGNVPESGSTTGPQSGSGNVPESGSTTGPQSGSGNVPESGSTTVPQSGSGNVPESGSTNPHETTPEEGTLTPDQGTTPETSGTTNPVVHVRPDGTRSQTVVGAIVSEDNNDGVVVRDLTIDGAAYRAGMEVGDKIIQINFQPVTSFASYNRLIASSSGATPFTIIDWRSGQVHTFYVNLR